MGDILRFPTNVAMGRSVAERQVGEMVMFNSGDPDKARSILLRNKIVVGWGVAENGVVTSFLNGNVGHTVKEVISVDGRPKVRTCCSGEVKEVLNWASDEILSGAPAVLLTRKQGDFFKPCELCANMERD